MSELDKLKEEVVAADDHADFAAGGYVALDCSVRAHRVKDKYIKALEVKLREREGACKCEGGRGQYRIGGGAYQCWDCNKATPPKKENNDVD